MSDRARSLVAAIARAPLDADERRIVVDALNEAWFPKPVAPRPVNAGNAKRKWKPEHDAMLKAMLDGGASVQDIAKATGRTVKGIWARKALIAPEHTDPIRSLQGHISGIYRAERRTNGHA